MSVAPAALAEQSHAAQVMTPASSTSTCPPRSTSPGVSTLAVIRSDAPPAVVLHVAPVSGGRLAAGHIVILGPPLRPASASARSGPPAKSTPPSVLAAGEALQPASAAQKIMDRMLRDICAPGGAYATRSRQKDKPL